MSTVVEPKNLAKDEFPGIVLQNHSVVAGAAYVDKYGVFGISKKLVNQHRLQISSNLKAIGLNIHEEEGASTSGEFVGLDFKITALASKSSVSGESV